MKPDLLCTEGLLDAGAVDLVYNHGWRAPTLASLRAAQHGIVDNAGESLPLPERAVIACFLAHAPDMLARIASERPDGQYIIIARDGDPSVGESGGANCNVKAWPAFVRHLFAINVVEASPRITPMPGAFWAFWDYSANDIPAALEVPRMSWSASRALVCHRHDGGALFKPDHERVRAVGYFRDKPWATVHPALLDATTPLDVCHLWSHPKFLAHVRLHDYLVCPVGYGVERASPWEAMAIGTIPIYRRHPEMLHFADMPIAFVDDWSEVTPEWCDANLHLRERAMDKIRLSYWVERIREKRTEIGP